MSEWMRVGGGSKELACLFACLPACPIHMLLKMPLLV